MGEIEIVSSCPYLVYVVSATRGALPMENVEEVLRFREPTPFQARHPSVRGLMRLRGSTCPVVDLGHVLTGDSCRAPRRIISLVVEGRRVGLVVDEVERVILLDPESFQALPPLLRNPRGGALAAFSESDAGFLSILSSARELTDGVWEGLEVDSEGAA